MDVAAAVGSVHYYDCQEIFNTLLDNYNPVFRLVVNNVFLYMKIIFNTKL